MQDTPWIDFLGDSHSAYFTEKPFFVGRLKLKKPLGYRLRGEAIPASSVAGFRPGVSTLQVKTRIAERAAESQRLILAFGQVDLELGYYYRLAIKGEKITPDSYVSWLIDLYGKFLADLDLRSVQLALKGVNLTALSPKAFATRYVSNIVNEKIKLPPIEADKKVARFILPEMDQNAMHLAFNASLAQLAQDRGYAYFDIVQETGVPTRARANQLRLADQYKTGFFNHHLADTVPVRRMHYLAAGKAFGLI